MLLPASNLKASCTRITFTQMRYQILYAHLWVRNLIVKVLTVPGKLCCKDIMTHNLRSRQLFTILTPFWITRGKCSYAHGTWPCLGIVCESKPVKTSCVYAWQDVLWINLYATLSKQGRPGFDVSYTGGTVQWGYVPIPHYGGNRRWFRPE